MGNPEDQGSDSIRLRSGELPWGQRGQEDLRGGCGWASGEGGQERVQETDGVQTSGLGKEG